MTSGRTTRSAEQCGGSLGGFALLARHDVTVGVEREADRRVTESLAHDLRVHARCEQMRCMGVAKIVERILGKPRRLDQPVERLADMCGRIGSPISFVNTRSSSAPSRRARTVPHAVSPVSLQNRRGALVEVDRAAAPLRLRHLDPLHPSEERGRRTNRHRRACEIDRVPPQRDEFAATHAGHRQQMEQRVVAVALDVREERD